MFPAQTSMHTYVLADASVFIAMQNEHPEVYHLETVLNLK